eukprot:Sspe_Gene.39370::Locus_18992_Transcript_3_6_Confidence_0.500_Length_508::g.39370::m.39370/K03259/EIF4E; translation initiation factor 4E
MCGYAGRGEELKRYQVWWYHMTSWKSTKQHYGDNIREVATVESIEDYWGCYKNILLPSELPEGSSYHLFKRGVKPLWEHEQNRRGGKWVTYWKEKECDIDDLYGPPRGGCTLSSQVDQAHPCPHW